MSKYLAFFIMACSNLLPFYFICKVFGITLFARFLRLKIIAALDLARCISNFFNYLASGRVLLAIGIFNKYVKEFMINIPLVQ